jgi:hypothetical protein
MSTPGRSPLGAFYRSPLGVRGRILALVGYVYGGFDGEGRLQDCDSWDESNWASETDMPSPARNSPVASTIGSTGYVYGGYGGGDLRDCDSWDESSWANEADMPSPGRRYPGASTI